MDDKIKAIIGFVLIILAIISYWCPVYTKHWKLSAQLFY